MGYRLMGWLHATAAGALGRERGQGTVEYIGIVLLIATVLGLVVAMGRKNGDLDIAKTVVTKLKQAIAGIQQK